MEVKIGVSHASRELTLDLDQSVDEIHKILTDALSEDNGVIELTDDKGRTVFIPADKLSYIEFATGSGRRVGFGPG